jgi:hypothetical protein
LFRKKREKNCERLSVGGGCDEKSELWMVDYMGVSSSRSLCSFRGGWLFGSEDGDHLVVSGARSSISAARSFGVNAGTSFRFWEKKWVRLRKKGRFIDLKLEYSSESKQEFSAAHC